MRLLFYLGHPAHYHLLKNAIYYFKENNHQVDILIKKKDVLEDLLISQGLDYLNIFPKTRGTSHFSMAKTLIQRNLRLFSFCTKNKPDLLIGTSVENTHIGKLLNIPAININEDDHDVVPLYSQLSYPLANTILAPESCSTGRWEYKTIHYNGYHELAYLHPNVFKPDRKVAQQYVPDSKPFYLIRFAKLSAHHDSGIRGLDDFSARRIIERLKKRGEVIISSEKQLDPAFEKYRITIDPKDMHHVMAFADLYIGDSQTMAAEAAVLGTPFIRYNDFVGRIGYLNDLENKYGLGYGISPSKPGKLFSTLDYLMDADNLRSHFQAKRLAMLSDTIDVNSFMIWFIEHFPHSKHIMKKNPDFQFQFATADKTVLMKEVPISFYESQTSNILTTKQM